LIANAIGLRRGDPVALLIARRWSGVMAVTFAVGAVTGTILSFEMGLLWPVLMGRFGGAFGIPPAVEGLFFFLEAIFIAIYVYGWSRLSPRAHFLGGIPVAIAGIGGTFSVVAANSWMNQPAGYVAPSLGLLYYLDQRSRLGGHVAPTSPNGGDHGARHVPTSAASADRRAEEDQAADHRR
jgi:cytochrome bd-type quinol oxidase subunit 1